MTCPSASFAAVAANSGLDFVFIDTEHIPLDRDTLAKMCTMYKALGLPPLVRIPKADATLCRMAIDAGACGIVAPYSAHAPAHSSQHSTAHSSKHRQSKRSRARIRRPS